MLWLCLRFPHFPVELQQPSDPDCVAIVDRHGNRRKLIACNAAARSQGIHAGMDATVGLARNPNLKLLDRSIQSEVRALKALAGCCEQFTSAICLDVQRRLLWLEVGGSARYFKGLPRLQESISVEMTRLGYTAQLAIAPTLEAAALLADCATGAAALRIEEMRELITQIDLAHLSLAPAMIDHLRIAGLRSVGDVLAVPAAALARRFGPEFTDYLQRLTGTRPDPRPRYRAPENYRRHVDCPYPIDTIEALLFPLRRILQELQGYLRGRDMAVQSLSITLRHRDSPATALQLRMSTPQRDASQIFAVLRETLERTRLAEPVIDILVKIEELAPAQIAQYDLFDESTQCDIDWSAVLDRLRARLGEDAVRELHLADDHRPEKAWCVRTDAAPVEPDLYLERPMWILSPKPLDRIPLLFGEPERIEAGWWEGEHASRDYYFARTPEGARVWVYRDCLTQRWYLQGLWG